MPQRFAARSHSTHSSMTLRARAARWSAACAAALAATLALAACGGGSSSTSAAGQTGSASAGAVPSGLTGATLTIAFSPPLSLNPALGGISTSAVLYGSLAYGSLIYQRPDGTFVPDLATSWGYLPGSQNEKFEVTLRSGVKFSDGSVMTPQSVANSIEYFAKAHGPQGFTMATLKSAAPSGPDTVLLTFTAPTPDMPFVLSQTQPVGMIIGPKGLANPASLGTSTDGAGAYVLNTTATVANSQYVFDVRPAYWNPAAMHYNKIVVQTFTDPQSAISAVQSGQFQAAALTNLPASSATTAKSAGLNVTSGPTFIDGLIPMDRNGSISPLGKLQVRQAINYAIDRTGLATAIGGPGSTGLDQTAVPGATGYDSSLGDTYSQNLAKAKQLLASAGYANGFTLPVLDCVALDPNSALAAGLQSDLAKIGIKVAITAVAGPAQFVPASLTKKYPAIVWPIAAQGPGYYYSVNFALAPFSNAFGSTSADLQSLMTSAAGAPSGSAANAMFQKVNQYLVNNAWFAPVYSASTTYIVSPTVANVSAPNAQNNTIDPIGPAPDLSWYPGK
jgi:peptide/nickel transport system substrate-binding protein